MPAAVASMYYVRCVHDVHACLHCAPARCTVCIYVCTYVYVVQSCGPQQCHTHGSAWWTLHDDRNLLPGYAS